MARTKADADEVFAWDYGETGPQLPDDVGPWGFGEMAGRGVKEGIDAAERLQTARTLRRITKKA